MKISIGKIGVELELDVGNRGEYISERLKEIPDYPYKKWGKLLGMEMSVDDEYYKSQVEFKTFPEAPTKDYIERIQKFTQDVLECRASRIYGDSPMYVGTHIHLFLEKDGKPFEKMVEVKLQVVDYIYKELTKFFIELLNTEGINVVLVKQEISRVIRNHNILRFFDQKYMGDKLRRNLQSQGDDYRLFQEGTDKPKYSPVLWSLKNENGKPHSFELRIIPNSFFYLKSSEYLVEFLGNVETMINNKPKTSEVAKINEGLKAGIIASHLRLKLAMDCLKNWGNEKAIAILNGEEVVAPVIEERNPFGFTSASFRSSIRFETRSGLTIDPASPINTINHNEIPQITQLREPEFCRKIRDNIVNKGVYRSVYGVKFMNTNEGAWYMEGILIPRGFDLYQLILKFYRANGFTKITAPQIIEGIQ